MLLYQKILLVNGPNLQLLGLREPHIYGTTTLAKIEQQLIDYASSHGIELRCFQSNHEGAIVDEIGAYLVNQQAIDGVIINPAALTHTSIAIRDALCAINKPFIEVHLSNIHQRESFRHHSYFSDKAVGVICGLGDLGYRLALDWFIAQNNASKQ